MAFKRFELIDEEQFIVPEVITLSDSFSLSDEFIRIYTDIMYITAPLYRYMLDYNGAITETYTNATVGRGTSVIRDVNGSFIGFGGSRTYKFKSNGALNTAFGTSGYIAELAGGYTGIVTDLDRNIYTEYTNDGYVRKFSPEGVELWQSDIDVTNYIDCQLDLSEDHVVVGTFTGYGDLDIVWLFDREDGHFVSSLIELPRYTRCNFIDYDERRDRICMGLYISGTITSSNVLRSFRIYEKSTETLLYNSTFSVGYGRSIYRLEDHYYIYAYNVGVPSDTRATWQGHTGHIFKVKINLDSLEVVATYTFPTSYLPTTLRYTLAADQYGRVWAEAYYKPGDVILYYKLFVLDMDLNLVSIPSIELLQGGLACIPFVRDYNLGILPSTYPL